MTSPRNSPCPCGSGKKYKRCCAGKNPPRSGNGRADPYHPGFSAPALAAVRSSHVWEADILPLPALADNPFIRRQVLVLVVAAGVVVDATLVAVDFSEPEALARLLRAGLERSARAAGTWPQHIRVRHAELAAALEPHLPDGCTPEVDFYLDEVEAVALPLIRHLAPDAEWPPAHPTLTWAAWGLPATHVAPLFTAFARFFRAAPWRWIDEGSPLWIEWEDGREWVASVAGAAGAGFGMIIHSDPRNVEASLDDAPSDQSLDLAGWVVMVSSEEMRNIPEVQRREILRSGWELESPDAVPVVTPVLTPGGGFSRLVAASVTTVLDAVAGFAERKGEQILEPVEHVYSGDGLMLRYLPPDAPRPETPPLIAELEEEIRSGKLESVKEVDAWLANRTDQYNRSPQPELSGLSPFQAMQLFQGNWADEGALRIAEDIPLVDLQGARFVHNAREFLGALVETDGTPATKAGNLRRAFVAEMLERMMWRDGEVEDIRYMNRVINEHDVWRLHSLRVVLDVGGLIQRRKGHFRPTRKGRTLAADAKAGALAAHLFRTVFRQFNLAYLDGALEWPELQEVAPLLLWRTGVEAGGWTDLATLADRTLPSRLRDGPPRPPALAASFAFKEKVPFAFRRRIVEVLLDFGLLEERDSTPAGASRWEREFEVRLTPLYPRMVQFEFDDNG